MSTEMNLVSNFASDHCRQLAGCKLMPRLTGSTFVSLVSAALLNVAAIYVAAIYVASINAPLFAGQFNPTRNIGDQVTGWTNLPGADDKLHSLSDLKAFDVVVVVFTCNSCPYAVDYEDRINSLAKKFVDSKVSAAVVAINSNKIEADLLPAMKKRSTEKGFQFAYLFDESQEVCKQFGAVRTPEFLVLDKDRRIAYMGAFDDNTKAELVKQKYLEDAVSALLASKPVAIQETAPVGCLIRLDRKRK